MRHCLKKALLIIFTTKKIQQIIFRSDFSKFLYHQLDLKIDVWKNYVDILTNMEDIRNLLSFSRKMNFWLFFLKAQKCSCENENTTKSIFLNKHNTLDNIKLPFLCLSCRWPKMRQSLNLIFFFKNTYTVYPSFYSNLNEKFLVNFQYCFTITSYIWFRNDIIHATCVVIQKRVYLFDLWMHV